MKVLFLGNNRAAWKALAWLKGEGEEVAGLVLHPMDRRRCGEEMLETAALDPSRVFDGARLQDPQVLEGIASLKADMALSVYFGYILKPEFLSLFPSGVVNLHPALLPYNRGAHPNVWSLVDATPAGASLHYVDAGVDTGDIIAQRPVPASATDTGETLYRRLEQASVELLREAWPLVRSGRAPRRPQNGGGTLHKVKDVERIDAIDLDKSYRARDLINILRARTFPPYGGAYFVENGRKIHMRLQLIPEEELGGDA